MDDRRKPIGIGFWFVAGLGAMLLYALSIGPALWLAVQIPGSPDWAFDVVEAVYYPLDLAIPDGGKAYELLNWYLELWLDLKMPAR